MILAETNFILKIVTNRNISVIRLLVHCYMCSVFTTKK